MRRIDRADLGSTTVAPALSVALIVTSAACGAPEGVEADPPGPPEVRAETEMVEDLPVPIERDYAAVAADDTLRVLVIYNSTSYFLYRGEPRGLEYELLRAFADDHDLVLDPVVVRHRARLFHRLNRGEGDVVAARLTPIDAFRPHVNFTEPLYRTRPSLVQRTGDDGVPEPVEDVLEAEPPGDALDVPEPLHVSARLVTRPSQLANDTVHLPRASEYYGRLVELSDTLGGTMEVVELEEALSDERLIRAVARGEVRFTVSQENLARLKQGYFSNLEVRPVMGRMHPVAWAVRRASPVLRDSLDAWLSRNESLRDELYESYFTDRAGHRERTESEYLTTETGRLSRYDSLFAANAERIGWDWRLLASQAFQESRFNPRARSWAGAMGLLQLMPGTARDLRVRDPYAPSENVRGAAEYLEWLDEYWLEEIEDPGERLRFVLGSYNAGFGHVEDARRLADKHGDDPSRWEDIAYWLLQLSRRSVHRDPVVRYGWVRGIEPVTYVDRVLERYRHYLQMVPITPVT